MNSTLKLFAAALIAVGCNQAMAQDESQSVEIEAAAFQTDDGAPAAMVITSEQFGDGPAEMRIMTGDATGMTFMSDGPHFMPMATDGFGLLNNRSVQKDLELVDDQMEQIRSVQKDFDKRIRDSLGDLKSGRLDLSNIDSLKQTIADMQAQKKEAVNNLLLPHQQERLKQVALQMKMKNRGTANTIGAMAEELGLSKEQVEKMKKRSTELKQEIAEKTAQLRQDAKDELMGMLSPAQRQKLDDMIGDEYKPASPAANPAFNRNAFRFKRPGDQ